MSEFCFIFVTSKSIQYTEKIISSWDSDLKKSITQVTKYAVTLGIRSKLMI